MQESEAQWPRGTDNTAAVSQGKTNCQDQRPNGQSMCPDSRHNRNLRTGSQSAEWKIIETENKNAKNRLEYH